MTWKKLAAAIAATFVITNSLMAPAAAFPASWRLLEALFTGGTPAIGRPRSIDLTETPDIITPRKTAVSSSTPHFKWNQVPQILSYRVILRGPSGILWETSVAGNEITYAGVPKLRSSVRYTLTVKTETYEDASGFVTVISPEDVSSSGTSFYVLAEADLAPLNENLAAIAGQDLTPLAIGLRQARLYREYDLMSDAIALLESLKERELDSGVLHRLLGELYLQVELSAQARAAFTQARAIALETGAAAEQADASVFLAHIAMGARNPEEAMIFLAEAQGLYRTLGDGEKAQAVADWLATL